MRTLLLKKDYKEAATHLVGQFPDRSHASLTIDSDAKIIAPDGKISAVLLSNAIPPELHKLAFELWKPLDGLVSNRATAVGTLSLPRSLNKDGTPSKRSGVNVHVLEVVEARQGILGFIDRPHRKKTTLTKRCPEMLDANRRLIEIANALYAHNLPHLYATTRSA
jgi:hypothetical protein